MKLTKSKLKQIIKEELEEVAGVGLSDMSADPDFKSGESAPGRDVLQETDKYEISRVPVRGKKIDSSVFVAELKCDTLDHGGYCPSVSFKSMGSLKTLDDNTLDMVLDHVIAMNIKS